MRCNGTGTCLLSNFWAIDTLLCSKRLDSGQTYCILLHPLYTVAVRQVQFSCGDSDYFLDSGQTYVASALNSSRGRFSFHAVIQIIFGTVYLIMDYSNKINLSIPHNFLNVLLSKYFNNIRVYVSRFDLMWCGEGGSKIS